MKVNVVTPSGVTPSDANTCNVAVHVPVTPAGTRLLNDTVLAIVLMVVWKLAMLYTFAPCCQVTATTTSRLPPVLCRTKPALTVEPAVKVVDGVPEDVVV